VFSYKLSENAEVRLLEERHAQQLTDLTDRNREHLREWLPWVDTNRTVVELPVVGSLQIAHHLPVFSDSLLDASLEASGARAPLVVLSLVFKPFAFALWPRVETGVLEGLGVSFALHELAFEVLVQFVQEIGPEL
jgi:hypothetical protein